MCVTYINLSKIYMFLMFVNVTAMFVNDFTLVNVHV